MSLLTSEECELSDTFAEMKKGASISNVIQKLYNKRLPGWETIFTSSCCTLLGKYPLPLSNDTSKLKF